MFSKSQRFENKTVGCGADLGAYNPKEIVKPIGGVIPKVERFCDPKCSSSVKSDTESVQSDLSSQVFRTPKTVRKLHASSVCKKSSKKPDAVLTRSHSSDSLTKELLEAKNVEISNKDDTISEYEMQMREMKNTIMGLEEKLIYLSSEKSKLDEKIFQMESTINPQNIKCLLCEGHDTDLLLTVDDYCDTHKELEMLSKQVALLHSEKVTLLNEGLEEKLMWHSQLKICQEMAEDEISKSHLKIVEMQKQLDSCNADIINLTEKCQTLEDEVSDKQDSIFNLLIQLKTIKADGEREKLQTVKDLEELRVEIDKINIDKNRLGFTLESTRQTIEVLGTRLRSSDENVEKLKEELYEAEILKKQLNEDLTKARNDLQSCKTEYNELLITIVSSKAALEEYQESVLEKSEDCVRSLSDMEKKCTQDVLNVKNNLLDDINTFKKCTSTYISELEIKLDAKDDLTAQLKSQCEAAFKTITECRNFLFMAESQLELKDQEIHEVSTQNDRLSGTLAAVEQEKNELEVILNEFSNLAESRDQKIYEYMKLLCGRDEDVADAEDRARKLSQFLEATEYIVTEKNLEIQRLSEDLTKINEENDLLHGFQDDVENTNKKFEDERKDALEKYETLQCQYEDIIKIKIDQEISLKKEVSSLEQKLRDLVEQAKTTDVDLLRLQCKNYEAELEEMTCKYTDLLGHQNNKQKIKHVIDLKNQNSHLKELSFCGVKSKLFSIDANIASMLDYLHRTKLAFKENERLMLTVQKQTTLIDKLKKDQSEMVIAKSPHASRKQMLTLGKENSPIGKSPKRAASPKVNPGGPLTPLKDLNR